MTRHDMPMHYVTLATDRDYIVFNVKVCEEAYVILSQDPGVTDSSAYHIVMGMESSSKTEIRKQSPSSETITFDTENVLQCNEKVQIWVQWNSGKIELGTGGKVGSDRLVEWRDATPYDINGFSLASRYTTPAEWDLQIDSGEI